MASCKVPQGNSLLYDPRMAMLLAEPGSGVGYKSKWVGQRLGARGTTSLLAEAEWQGGSPEGWAGILQVQGV